MSTQVCIGICTRNREEYLPDSLTSVLKQETKSKFEIVIANDQSEYDVQKVINSVVEQHPNSNLARVLLVDAPKNEDKSPHGEAAMRNLIIENTQAEAIVWLDDDDCLIEGAISIYEQYLSKFSEHQIFYPNLLRTNSLLKPEREYSYRPVPSNLIYASLLLGSIFPNGGSCIRTHLLRKLKGYDTSYSVGTDYNFWIRAALSGAKFIHIPKFLYFYRSHDTNAALDKENDKFFESNARCYRILLEVVKDEYLFPFFDWEENPIKSMQQKALSLLTLSKRHCDNEIADGSIQFLESENLPENYKKLFLYLKSQQMPLSFDTAAVALQNIIETDVTMDGSTHVQSA